MTAMCLVPGQWKVTSRGVAGWAGGGTPCCHYGGDSERGEMTQCSHVAKIPPPSPSAGEIVRKKGKKVLLLLAAVLHEFPMNM